MANVLSSKLYCWNKTVFRISRIFHRALTQIKWPQPCISASCENVYIFVSVYIHTCMEHYILAISRFCISFFFFFYIWPKNAALTTIYHSSQDMPMMNISQGWRQGLEKWPRGRFLSKMSSVIFGLNRSNIVIFLVLCHFVPLYPFQ